MDKQTQIMWEAEFLRQYPKPDCEIKGIHELIEINRMLFEAKKPDIVKILKDDIDYENPWEWFHANDVYSREVHNTDKIQMLVIEKERNMQPWEDWKKECHERFSAIFSAQPIYALEELRKGNLLTEGNV